MSNWKLHKFVFPFILLCLRQAVCSCEDRWREGLRQSQSISTASTGQPVINRSDQADNTSTIPPLILHAALKDHWLDHYKQKLLKDMNMHRAPDPGSRRLPKSIRTQLERIKVREGDPMDQDECSTTSPTAKTEHVRDVLAQAPRMTSRNRPPGWLMLDSRAKPMKRVVSSTKNTADNRFAENQMRSYFNLNSIPESDIKNATLYLHIQRPSTNSNVPIGAELDEVHVHVYKYTSEAEVMLQPVISRTFKQNLVVGVWLSIDLTELTKQWARTPANNYGVMIKAERNGVNYINRTNDIFNRTSTIILAMDIDETATRTTTVPISEETTCSAENPDEKCCRYPLEINFESFGWDWVIAPKRFNAYYCAGTCPINYKQISPHAHLMQQLDMLQSTTDTQHKRNLGPCCTPQDYQDIKIIYIGQDRSVRETWIPGAIVLRCGCA